jgi:ubiquinone biosynthesis protein COQ4
MALSETIDAQAPALAAPIGAPRRDWLAALRALKRLLSDREDTGQVFEIMRALNGDSTARGYRRLLDTAEGGRLAFEHVELAPRLMDDAWLDSFAAGTVGAAYREFIRSEHLSAEGLAEISRRQRRGRGDEAHPYAWFGRRIRDTHDIWHILSGYHRDGLGEASLVAFSHAQTGGLGWALIALGAAVRALREGQRTAVRAIWQGYRRGRKAAWLPAEDYERLMGEPLEAARRRLNITPPTLYQTVVAGAALRPERGRPRPHFLDIEAGIRRR